MAKESAMMRAAIRAGLVTSLSTAVWNKVRVEGRVLARATEAARLGHLLEARAARGTLPLDIVSERRLAPLLDTTNVEQMEAVATRPNRGLAAKAVDTDHALVVICQELLDQALGQV